MDEVKDAMKKGLSVVHLHQGKLLMTKEKGIKTNRAKSGPDSTTFFLQRSSRGSR